jgi:hypothetical protein
MTLIIAAITREIAILSSDRRIQYTRRTSESEIEVITSEDTDTKSAIIDGRYVLGYAGMGRIIRPGATHQGWRVEAWMTTELGHDASEDVFFDALAEKFGLVCEEVAFARPHVFVAAGYSGSDNTPTLVTVSNSRQFPYTFDVSRRTLADGEPFMYQAFGEKLTDAQRTLIEPRLKWLTTWAVDQPYPLHKIFTRVTREVSAASEGRVGETVVVTSFPRAALPLDVGATYFYDGIDKDLYRSMEVSVTYPADGSKTEYQPARISQGITLGAGVSMLLDEGWIGPQPGDTDPDAT